MSKEKPVTKDDDLEDGELFEPQTPEEFYEQALEFEVTAGHFMEYSYTDKYYHMAMDILQTLFEDMPEARADYDRILRKLHTARAQEKINIYNKACERRDIAKSTYAYEQASKAFLAFDEFEETWPIDENLADPLVLGRMHKLSNVQDQAARCLKLGEGLTKKRQRKNLGIFALVLAAAIALAFLSQTAVFRKYLAMGEDLVGYNSRAWWDYEVAFEAMGDESLHDNALKCRYELASHALKSQDDELALTHLPALARENYKDSDQLLVQKELSLISAAAIGDTVTYGDTEWVVLDQDGSKYLLYRTTAVPPRAFQMDTTKGNTWAESSLREWLNSSYLEENFSAEEINAIVTTDVVADANPEYGTPSGEDTQDKVFLLSITEADKYNAYLITTQQCSWTRTAGAVEGTIAFIGPDKKTMCYGYDPASENLSVKPVFWVDTAVESE